MLTALGTHSAYAASGFWDTEIPNANRASIYRVYYEIPDTVETNKTQLVTVRFFFMQMGDTTKSAKTDKIELQLDAKSKSWKVTVVQEIKDLKRPGDLWGPFNQQFKVLDSDFDLQAQEAVRVKVSIAVNFREIDFYGKEYSHVAGGDVTAELKSLRVPQIIDYLKMAIPFITGILGLAH